MHFYTRVRDPDSSDREYLFEAEVMKRVDMHLSTFFKFGNTASQDGSKSVSNTTNSDSVAPSTLLNYNFD